MNQIPKIVTYASPDAPIAQRWMALLFGNYGRTAKGETFYTHLPMMFFGATKELAVAAAEGWWQEEQRKEQDKANTHERLARARAARRG